MDILKAIYDRHSVRHYDGKPLSDIHVKELNEYINKLNLKYNMYLQLMINEPKAFGGEKAKISNITGCVNYLVIVGPKEKDLYEKTGYVGEKFVLYAQGLGINSCWAAITYDKQMELYDIGSNEELCIVIALGYGTTQGRAHISKNIKDVIINESNLPKWFLDGVDLALLAPTGKNQQGFKLELIGNDKVKITNHSLCQDIDVGIVKLHFEIGAQDKKFEWIKN